MSNVLDATTLKLRRVALAVTLCQTALALSCASAAGPPIQAEKPTAALDWQMQPHFPGTDVIQAPPPPPLACDDDAHGKYGLGPFACTDAAGNPGCRYAMALDDSLTFTSTPCLTRQCRPGTVAACATPCHSSGTETCDASGTWGACVALETCDGVDNDCDGLVDNGGVCQVPLSAWRPDHEPGFDTWLDGCASTSPSNLKLETFTWTVQLPTGPVTWSTPECRAKFTFPAEDTYDVTLTVTDELGLESDPVERADVRIRDLLIVSLGDSVASGEGNPTTPTANGADPMWSDRRCHRSLLSGHARTARALEDADAHTSVTFVALGCSGATINEGVLGPYAGQEFRSGDTPTLLPAQLPAAALLLKSLPKPVDAVLLQIGANDVKFSKVVKDCAVPTCVPPTGFEDECTCATLKESKFVADGLAALTLVGYPSLGLQLAKSPRFKTAPVYIADYPDPTHADDGTLCHEIRYLKAVVDLVVAGAKDLPSTLSAGDVATSGLGSLLKGSGFADGLIDAAEIAWADDNVIGPLNAGVRAAAEANRWTFVPGVTAAFSHHGYCADDHWIVRYDESKASQINEDGTMHPNADGHRAYAALFYAALARELVVSVDPKVTP